MGAKWETQLSGSESGNEDDDEASGAASAMYGLDGDASSVERSMSTMERPKTTSVAEYIVQDLVQHMVGDHSEKEALSSDVHEEDDLGWEQVSLRPAKEVGTGREGYLGGTVEGASAGKEGSVSGYGLEGHVSANVNATNELDALGGEMDVGQGDVSEHDPDGVASAVAAIGELEQAEYKDDPSAGLDVGSGCPGDPGGSSAVQNVQNDLGGLKSGLRCGLSDHADLYAVLDVVLGVLGVVVLSVDESYRAKAHAKGEKGERGHLEAQVEPVVGEKQDEAATACEVDGGHVGELVRG
ncbi:hypothetical protein BGZ52_008693 [Haplosporangium bisporale]|nr:hypothetical protein BGZ52_008693 [Haplosporangium bisporale]